jgi:hypothetical protein
MKVLVDEGDLQDNGPQYDKSDALYLGDEAKRRGALHTNINVGIGSAEHGGQTYHRFSGYPVHDPLPERTLWDKAKVAHDALQQVMDHSVSLVEASNLPNELLEEFKATLGALKTWGQGSTFDKDSAGRPLRDRLRRTS